MAASEKIVILLVDDHEVGRYGKRRILEQAGFEVLETASGMDGLRLVEVGHPRLVILDVRLPDVDGWEVCRRIKTNPETASVLVLQMSATFVNDADTVRALESGADACLTEPFEPPVLIATVRALLRARQAEDALRDVLAREHVARLMAESANRTKDEFLATLSHELRSPLSAILTWVTLLLGGKAEEAVVRRGLEAIERNTRQQANLIEDLLDVSRIISGKMVLEPTLVDLASVVEGALESARPAVEAKGLRIDARIDPHMDPVPGDAGRLQQVVGNLVSNAVKFTPKGGRIEVRVEGDGAGVRIQVRDTGKGIEAAFLPHIFERFRQGDSSTTRAEGGLGLGLAIVRHLVELHGGTVEAESHGPGTGATFTVRLSRDAIQPTPGAAVSAVSSPTPRPIALPTLAGVRVLVVDDEPDARDAVSAVLRQCGGDAVTAASASEALRALDESVPDVMVSDIAMPVEDGYALIRQVRARTDRARDVPALALTAYAGGEGRRRVFEAGYQAYLGKPVDARELVGAVARLARRD